MDTIQKDYADAADCAAHMGDDDATVRATVGWEVVSCELDYVGSYGAPPSASTPLRATWRLSLVSAASPPAPKKR